MSRGTPRLFEAVGWWRGNLVDENVRTMCEYVHGELCVCIEMIALLINFERLMLGLS